MNDGWIEAYAQIAAQRLAAEIDKDILWYLSDDNIEEPEVVWDMIEHEFRLHTLVKLGKVLDAANVPEDERFITTNYRIKAAGLLERGMSHKQSSVSSILIPATIL